MGFLEAFRGNTNGAKHLRNVSTHVNFPRNISVENMIRPGKVKKNVPKTAKLKLKVIIHAFGLSRCPSSERHGMSPTDMGGYCKGFMWRGTNMWMPLCSFRDNFGFHKK